MSATTYGKARSIDALILKRQSVPCWTNQNFIKFFLSAGMAFSQLVRSPQTSLSREQRERIQKLYTLLDHSPESLQKDLVGLHIFASVHNIRFPNAHIMRADAVHLILAFSEKINVVLENPKKFSSNEYKDLINQSLKICEVGKPFAKVKMK